MVLVLYQKMRCLILEMDLFGGSDHDGDGELDTLPPIEGQATKGEILGYMVLVLSRFMSCDKVFKGGYMLDDLLHGYGEPIHDVDLSIARKGDYDGVKNVLEGISEQFKASGLIAEYTIKPSIGEGMSGGIDMYAANGRKILGVDIGLHNISYGIRHYDLGFTSVDGFSVERMLSDKLSAITTKKRFRRTKDLYDFYAITNFFDIDMHELTDFINSSGKVEWDNIPFNDDVLTQYKHAWDKLVLESYNNDRVIEKPEFLDAIRRLYAIALPIKNGDSCHRWEHVYGRLI